MSEPYTGADRPDYKMRERVRIIAGRYRHREFYVKDIRYNHDLGRFQYLYDGETCGGWFSDLEIEPIGERAAPLLDQ